MYSMVTIVNNTVLYFKADSSKFPKPGFNIMWTVNFQMFKLDLDKAEEQDQIANICWIMRKAREFQKNIYFCFTDYIKTFDCIDHNKLWKILKEMGISDQWTCLLRNLYAGQEVTLQTKLVEVTEFQLSYFKS